MRYHEADFNPGATMDQTARFSKRPLPPYRFAKHESPHPTQHPDGHFRGKKSFACLEFDGSNWRDCEGYLFALDLFNHGYFWECHEVLEDLWHDTDRSTPLGHFIQGFIQCTISHWHRVAGRESAARNIMKRTPRHVEAAGSLRMGTSLGWLLEETRRFVADPGSDPARIIPGVD
jgi:hypothetical protein